MTEQNFGIENDKVYIQQRKIFLCSQTCLKGRLFMTITVYKRQLHLPIRE